jgi:hypothetical protein
MRRITFLKFLRGKIIKRERSDGGTRVYFEDGTTALLGVMPDKVQ